MENKKERTKRLQLEYRTKVKEAAKKEKKLIKDNIWQLFSEYTREEIISCVNYDGEYKLSSDCPDISLILSEVYDNETLTPIFSIKSSLTMARKRNGKKISFRYR